MARFKVEVPWKPWEKRDGVNPGYVVSAGQMIGFWCRRCKCSRSVDGRIPIKIPGTTKILYYICAQHKHETEAT